MTRRIQLQDAFRLAVSMTLFYWLALWMDWDMPKYGGLAIVLISLGTTGASLQKGVLRIVGTTVGLAIGMLGLALFAQERWLMLAFLSAHLVFVGYFGAAILGATAGQFSWTIVLYALLSLTVVRMLPVFLVMTGLRTDTEGKLFVGWFGPRGLASIVFIVIVMDASVPNIDVLVTVVSYTVIGSIILHGVTANPWAKAFGAREKAAGAPA